VNLKASDAWVRRPARPAGRDGLDPDLNAHCPKRQRAYLETFQRKHAAICTAITRQDAAGARGDAPACRQLASGSCGHGWRPYRRQNAWCHRLLSPDGPPQPITSVECFPSSKGCSRWSLRSRASGPPPAALITGEQSKFRSFIGLPPLKPGTIRCAVMLVAPKRPLNPATRNLLHTAVTRSTGLALDRSCR
jgi:hypothetical protein